jgi:hypothetical protein
MDPERSASLNLAGNAHTVELAAGRSSAPATRRPPCAENAGAMTAGTSARERYLVISVAILTGARSGAAGGAFWWASSQSGSMPQFARATVPVRRLRPAPVRRSGASGISWLR